nr:hypothetical protein [uncultured Comamonas sp.]
MSHAHALPQWNQDQRILFHTTLNKWLVVCSDDEYQNLMNLREQVAPGQVCSFIKLIRSCFARPDLSGLLPASLVQLLQAGSLLPVYAGVTASAG